MQQEYLFLWQVCLWSFHFMLLQSILEWCLAATFVTSFSIQYISHFVCISISIGWCCQSNYSSQCVNRYFRNRMTQCPRRTFYLHIPTWTYVSSQVRQDLQGDILTLSTSVLKTYVQTHTSSVRGISALVVTYWVSILLRGSVDVVCCNTNCNCNTTLSSSCYTRASQA
jgi:hypothetical protein